MVHGTAMYMGMYMYYARPKTGGIIVPIVPFPICQEIREVAFDLISVDERKNVYIESSSRPSGKYLFPY